MTLQLLTPKELPESIYHGEDYSGYLSGSELWAYFNSCPAEYVYGERKESQSMVTGSAVHSEVLEMQTFDELYYRGFESTDETLTSDAAIKAKLKALGVTGYSAKSGTALADMLLEKEPDSIIRTIEEKRLADENEGKTMLKHEQYDMAKDMRSQLMQYGEYAKCVNDGLCEHSIVGEVELFGEIVKVKTRPDIIYTNAIINYKTCASAKPEKLIQDCFNFGYFAKEVFNSMVFEKLYKEWPEIRILAQSKKKPYICTGFTFTDEMIAIGRSQVERAFSMWIACKKAGAVVDFAQGKWLSDLDVPAWMVAKSEI